MWRFGPREEASTPASTCPGLWDGPSVDRPPAQERGLPAILHALTMEVSRQGAMHWVHNSLACRHLDEQKT